MIRMRKIKKIVMARRAAVVLFMILVTGAYRPVFASDESTTKITLVQAAVAAAGRLGVAADEVEFTEPSVAALGRMEALVERFRTAVAALSGIDPSFIGRDERDCLIETAHAACVVAGRWLLSFADRGMDDACPLAAAAAGLSEDLASALREEVFARRILEREAYLHLARVGAETVPDTAGWGLENATAWKTAFRGSSPESREIWERLKDDPRYGDYYHPFKLSASVASSFKAWMVSPAVRSRGTVVGKTFAALRFLYEKLRLRLRYDYAADDGKTTKFAQGAEYLCLEFSQRGYADGDCLSTAFLLCTLLREAGLKSCIVRTVAGEDGKLLLSHYSVAVKTGGAPFIIDIGLGILDSRPVELIPLDDGSAILENLRFTEEAEYGGGELSEEECAQVNGKYDMLLSSLPGRYDIYLDAINFAIDNTPEDTEAERLSILIERYRAELLSSRFPRAGARQRSVLRVALARALIESGAEAEAAELLETYRDEAIGCPIYFQRLKEAYLNLKRYEAAVRAAEEVVRATSGYDFTGMIEARAGLASIVGHLGGEAAARVLAGWRDAANCGNSLFSYDELHRRYVKRGVDRNIEYWVSTEPSVEELDGGESRIQWPAGTETSVRADGSVEKKRASLPAMLEVGARKVAIAVGAMMKVDREGKWKIEGNLVDTVELDSGFGTLRIVRDTVKPVYDLQYTSGGLLAHLEPGSCLLVAGQRLPLKCIDTYDGIYDIKIGATHLAAMLASDAELRFPGAALRLLRAGSGRVSIVITKGAIWADIDADSCLVLGDQSIKLAQRNKEQDGSSWDARIVDGEVSADLAEAIEIETGPVKARILPHKDPDSFTACIGKYSVKLWPARGSIADLGWYRGELDFAASGSVFSVWLNTGGTLQSLRFANPIPLRLGGGTLECPAGSTVSFGDGGIPSSVMLSSPVELENGFTAIKLEIDGEGRVSAGVSRDEGTVEVGGESYRYGVWSRAAFYADGSIRSVVTDEASELTTTWGVVHATRGGELEFDESGRLTAFQPSSGVLEFLGARMEVLFLDFHDPAGIPKSFPFDDGSGGRVDLCSTGFELSGLISGYHTIRTSVGEIAIGSRDADSFSEIRLSSRGLYAPLADAKEWPPLAVVPVALGKGKDPDAADLCIGFDGSVYSSYVESDGIATPEGPLFLSAETSDDLSVILGPGFISWAVRSEAGSPTVPSVREEFVVADEVFVRGHYSLADAPVRLPVRLGSSTYELDAGLRLLNDAGAVIGILLSEAFTLHFPNGQALLLPADSSVYLDPEGAVFACCEPCGRMKVFDTSGAVAFEDPPAEAADSDWYYLIAIAQIVQFPGARWTFATAVPIILRFEKQSGKATGIRVMGGPREPSEGVPSGWADDQWFELR